MTFVPTDRHQTERNRLSAILQVYASASLLCPVNKLACGILQLSLLTGLLDIATIKIQRLSALVM